MAHMGFNQISPSKLWIVEMIFSACFWGFGFHSSKAFESDWKLQKTSWNAETGFNFEDVWQMICWKTIASQMFQLFTKRDSCFAYYLDFDMHGGGTDILKCDLPYRSHMHSTLYVLWIFGNHRLGQPDEMKGIAGIATIYYLDVPWS